MIDINIESEVTFFLPQKLKEDVLSFFTITNPIFQQKMDMGLSLWGVPKDLKYYKYDKATSKVTIPIGGFSMLGKVFEKHGITKADLNIKDNRSVTSDIKYFKDLKFTGTLRPYQQEAHEILKLKTIGIIEAMTGSGKTILFVKLTTEKKVNTLILVNTLELLNQTIKAFTSFTNLSEKDIGIIGNGKYEIKPITVGLHQTMAKIDDAKLTEINNFFGQIIADEVHIVGAKTYYETMSKLSAKYKFGFSATPKRADNLTDLIFWATGPLIHKIPFEDLKQNVMVPSYEQVLTDYYFPFFDSSDFTFMMVDLAENKDRNNFIIDTLDPILQSKDSHVCILCNYTSQVEYLTKKLKEKNYKAEMLTSQVKKKIRIQIIEGLKSKQINIVVSTYALFSTGVDVAHLNYLVLAAPIKSEIKLRQSAGRIMRKAPNKTFAKIIDFVDYKIDYFANTSKKRKKLLEKIC